MVVVSFNTRDKLRRCLTAVGGDAEITVIDNASTDGSAEMVETDFPAARLVKNPENRGFGAANNQGIELSGGELVLLLNSDCYAEPGAIQELSEVFADKEVVASGGKLLNPDGTLQDSVAGPLTLWAVFLEQSFLEKIAGSGRYWRTRFLIGSDPVEVDQVMGACIMMRPVERFDERYFLYCEDTDLCLRLARHGKILYVPQARFTHELGSSSVGASRWLSVARYNRGKELYFEIHEGKIASVLCLVLDRYGAALRLIAYLILTILTLGLHPGFRSRILLWLRVLTAKRLGPDRPPRRAG